MTVNRAIIVRHEENGASILTPMQNDRPVFREPALSLIHPFRGPLRLKSNSFKIAWALKRTRGSPHLRKLPLFRALALSADKNPQNGSREDQVKPDIPRDNDRHLCDNCPARGKCGEHF